MKKFITILLLFVSFHYVDHKVTDYIVKQTIEPVKQEIYTVTATMYYPVASQCDSDPLVTAGMYRIIPGKASEQKWIAMSRDMLTRWGGKFNYGDLVQIAGAGHKDGVYKVVDTMNKRFKNRIDFLEDKGTKHYKFDNVTITKWNTQTQNENQLASL